MSVTILTKAKGKVDSGYRRTLSVSNGDLSLPGGWLCLIERSGTGRLTSRDEQRVSINLEELAKLAAKYLPSKDLGPGWSEPVPEVSRNPYPIHEDPFDTEF